MAKITLLSGYRYTNGNYVCVNCAHDEKNKETLKTFGTDRDTMFRGEFSETKCPKCALCKTKMNEVISNAYSRGAGVADEADEGETPKKSEPKKAPIEKASAPKKRGRPAKPKTDVPKKKRGRPAKAKVSLGEPIVKRGRGRPKGSKNKPKVMA